MDNFKTFLKNILKSQAAFVLRKKKPKIIAIIGSVGKTSTKTVLHSVLSKTHNVRKNDKTFITDIDLPMAVFGIPYGSDNVFHLIGDIFWGLQAMFSNRIYPEYLILEIEGQRAGEMEKLSFWLPISILIIKQVGDVPAHLESFKQVEDMLVEYRHVLATLPPDAKIIYHTDDKNIVSLVKKSPNQKISFGFSSLADVRANPYWIMYRDGKPSGMSFTLARPENGKRIDIQGFLGEHIVNAILVTVAVMSVIDNKPFSNKVTYEKIHFLPGRLKIISGKNNSVILDDSYNSSPTAVEEALEALKKIESKRKIAVLGDMFELGSFNIEAHKKMGTEAAFCDLLILVGMNAMYSFDAAVKAGLDEKKIHHFQTPAGAGSFLATQIQEGDCVLVKGSQDMRMERAVEKIMAEPTKKRQLLVRQEDEWKKR